jgi:exosortase A-associated hydrolase 2
MTPLYFGESTRRLFGLYTPAHARGGRQRGIVLCPPWGAEYLRAHRSMHQLAKLLAEAGFHVLRFDYSGTGDSAGDMPDTSLDRWAEDIGTAVEELKDTAGIPRVALLGLRLGGTLAARVASQRRKDVDTLVLWDPVVHGGEHLAELRQLDEATLNERGLKGNATELLGFPMTEAQARELQALELLQPPPTWPARTLVAVSEPTPSHEALRAALATSPNAVLELIESQSAWIEDRHSGAGAVPVKLLQRIVEWLA